MRKGLTLIELIFTVVIIALVFTVIPKIVFALKKSDNFVIRQDAIMNGFSMMKMISNLPWDENNTDSADILHVGTKGNFECNSTTHYRVGSFIGGRSCEDNLTASVIGLEGDYDDIDDFDGNLTKASFGKRIYEINTTVSYIENFTCSTSPCIIDLNISNNIVDKNTTNLKRVRSVVWYASENRPKKRLTQFNYTSANIGQMKLNKRVWGE